MGNTLQDLTTGAFNIAVGVLAADNVTEGSCNIMLGTSAGRFVTTGSDNIGIGACSLGLGTVTGQNNIALGFESLKNINSDSCNIGIGYRAGQCLGGSGGSNIAIGASVLDASPSSGGGNIGIGQSLFQDALTGDDNIAIGSGSSFAVTTGTRNITMGVNAGRFVRTGSCNVAIGDSALCAIAGCCLSGGGNTAVGQSALRSVRNTSSGNVGIGDCAGFTIQQAGCNIAIGSSAMGGTGDKTGSFQQAIGQFAGAFLTTGAFNTFMGASAGCCVTSGSSNVGIGNTALRATGTPITGNSNVALGNGAGQNIQGASAGNLFLGNAAGPSSVCTLSNSLYIHNSATASPLIFGCFSSGRVGINTNNPTQAFHVQGQACITNAIDVSGTTIASTNIEIGSAAVGDQNTFIDFHSSAAVDYNARISRCSGVNGQLVICNTGTGLTRLQSDGGTEAAPPSGLLFPLISRNCGDQTCGGTTQVVTGNLCGNDSPKIQFCREYSNSTRAWGVGIVDGLGTCDTASGAGSFGIFSGTTATSYGTPRLLVDEQGTGVAIGCNALGTAIRIRDCFSGNIAIGCNAGVATLNASAFSNIMIGTLSACSLTSGDGNLVIGECAGDKMTSGFCNLVIGSRAGSCCNTLTAPGITTGSCNIHIGFGTGQCTGSSSDVIIIGNELRPSPVSSTTYIDNIYNKAIAGGQVVCVNSSHQLASPSSSAYFKQNIQNLSIQTSSIYNLTVKEFEYKDNPIFKEVGLIAEEVEAALPEMVIYRPECEFKCGSTSSDLVPGSVRYQHLPLYMLPEVQKHETCISSMKCCIESLESQLSIIKQCLNIQ